MDKARFQTNPCGVEAATMAESGDGLVYRGGWMTFQGY